MGAETSLRVALAGVQTFRGYAIPVVENAESMTLVGHVLEADFVRAHNEASKDAYAERS